MHDVHLGLLAIMGICIASGVMGAWLSQKLRIPQVVGYIVIGVLIGDTGLGILHIGHIAALRPFNHFALGLIGFLVGGELHREIFKRYGKQFMAILLGEGFAAFLLVGGATGLITFLVVHNGLVALAAGLVFGAIASATDPASTIDVLWEYRSAGVLTTAIIAIVALDDALAMTLYGLGTSAASILMSSGSVSVGRALAHTALELGGAVAVGCVAGLVLNWLMHHLPQTEKRLGLSIGVVLLCIGVSVAFNMDVILATMAVGIVLINAAPRRSRKLFETVRSFSTPIYILFFVMVGARLSLKNMPGWIWLLVGIYVVMRCLGKWVGAMVTARAVGADTAVQRYLGMAIFAQGGVAVGLSIMASQNLQDIPVSGDMMLGDMIVFTVTATTLCVQVLGPLFARMAVRKAGEAGRNVTEDDVMEEWTVRDAVQTDVAPLREGTPLEEVIRHFAEQESFVYPVVSESGRIVGVLPFDLLKELLVDRDAWQWVVVKDVMQPASTRMNANRNLSDALLDMRDMQMESIPVVEGPEDDILVGVLDMREARRSVAAELVKRQSRAA